MKHYTVTAVPFEGHDTFNRAGQTFTAEPRQITVRDADPNHPHGPDEVTPEQFEEIKAEPRLKVETASGRPVNDAAKSAAEAEKAAPASSKK